MAPDNICPQTTSFCTVIHVVSGLPQLMCGTWMRAVNYLTTHYLLSNRQREAMRRADVNYRTTLYCCCLTPLSPTVVTCLREIADRAFV
ncbi:hypothetical protein J6590_061880 [Homalodisca vitripennis]|nr:hypothetical protein J6590_061880 [Homalodisca vitripennis]